jgi:hypothetical protein
MGRGRGSERLPAMGELEPQSGEVLGQHTAERREGSLYGDQGGGALSFLNSTLPQRAFVRGPTSDSLDQHYRESAARGSEQSPASQESDRQVTCTQSPLA